MDRTFLSGRGEIPHTYRYWSWVLEIGHFKGLGWGAIKFRIPWGLGVSKFKIHPWEIKRPRESALDFHVSSATQEMKSQTALSSLLSFHLNTLHRPRPHHFLPQSPRPICSLRRESRTGLKEIWPSISSLDLIGSLNLLRQTEDWRLIFYIS